MANALLTPREIQRWKEHDLRMQKLWIGSAELRVPGDDGINQLFVFRVVSMKTQKVHSREQLKKKTHKEENK